jgi:uncharacterized protein DUF3109
MFIIGEAMIEDQVAFERFACDLNACKGACCTLPGGRGAPLEDEEVDEIRNAYPVVEQFLSARHREIIGRHGMVEGVPGSFATTCVDEHDCVFVYYEDAIARCSIERAFQEGLIGWRKPLSCHLFPIRVSGNGATRLRYEKISECSPGRATGRNLNAPLHVFLKDALVRKFGESWYAEFRSACEQREASVSPL